jgi:hypothetical protein
VSGDEQGHAGEAEPCLCETGFTCLARHTVFVDESHNWTAEDVGRILTEIRSIRGEVSS